MPLNLTATSTSTLISRINQINAEPENNDQHTITLSGSSSAYQVSAAHTGGDYFGKNAFPPVKRKIKIIGNNISIARTGANKFRFFSVFKNNYAQLELDRLTLDNGDSGTDGQGAILGDNPLILTNCTIKKCKGALNGGALYITSSFYAYNCAFSENEVTGTNARGGCIFAVPNGSMNIESCVFTKNKAAQTGGQGGAIYNQGMGSVVSSCFSDNVAPGGASDIYNMNAPHNWWGNPNPPASSRYTISDVSYQRTSPLLIQNKLCIDSAARSITMTVIANGLNARMGPSADNAQVYVGGVPLQLAQGNYNLIGRATDETNQIWYAYTHNSRPEYMTWSAHLPDYLTINGNPALLPDYSLPMLYNFTNEGWGRPVSAGGVIRRAPFSLANADPNGSRFRGIGIIDGVSYSSIPDCLHPGLDFFPDAQIRNPIEVRAMADGILVGIGRASDGQNPTAWGAVDPGKFNVVIRSGGIFILYGHLETINEMFYYGSRIRAGDIIGTLTPQTGNTHLHIEVRIFIASDYSPIEPPVRPRFGSLNRASQEKPSIAVDPVEYMGDKGTFFASSPASGTCNSATINYTKDDYDDAILRGNEQYAIEEFNYRCNQLYHRMGFNMRSSSSAPIDPTNLTSPQP